MGEDQTTPQVVKFHILTTSATGPLEVVSPVCVRLLRNIGQSFAEELALVERHGYAAQERSGIMAKRRIVNKLVLDFFITSPPHFRLGLNTI